MSCYDALPAAVGALAAAIADGRSDEEIGLLAALFTQLGDSLATVLAGRACCPGGSCAGSGSIETLI